MDIGSAMRQRGAVTALTVLLMLAAPPVLADDGPPPDARVPPRLSYVHGDVSFWRPGAEAWAPAQVNTPLAPGDLLYVGQEGGLEIQMGPRAFVRAAAGPQLGLDNQEPDFLQFRLTGRATDLGVALVDRHTGEVLDPGARGADTGPGRQVGPDPGGRRARNCGRGRSAAWRLPSARPRRSCASWSG